MGPRERIRRAIQEPVSEAEKLLGELQDADGETKLSILISGWGRGLAAGLEELAIAIEEQPQKPATVASDSSRPEPAPNEVQTREPQERKDASADHTAADEEQLLEEAKRSREKTTEVREMRERGAPRSQ
jgi:hypothetical protein